MIDGRINAFKTDGDFVAVTQRKFPVSKEMAEQAYGYMLDSLSPDGLAKLPYWKTRSQGAKKMLGARKPISTTDIMDYGLFCEALKNEK